MRYHEITEAEALTPLARRVERQREGERERRKREKLRADEYKDHQREELIRGAKLIKQDCQPYLSQVKDPMLLRRGVKRDYNADPDAGRPMFNQRAAHLAGRRPQGSNMQDFKTWPDGKIKDHHTMVNEYFQATFGNPYRNGVMCTGDQLTSSRFGTDVAVFPIGEFKFLWSPLVQDLNHSHSLWERADQDFMTMLTNAQYQDTDLEAAIASKNEIMLWAKSYYTLDNNADRMFVKSLLK